MNRRQFSKSGLLLGMGVTTALASRSTAWSADRSADFQPMPDPPMFRARRSVWGITAMLLAALILHFAGHNSDASGGWLELKIVDGATGERMAARIRVQDASGRFVVPANATEVRIGTDVWFIADGTCRVQPAPGKVSIRAERGIEYRPVKLDLSYDARTAQSLMVSLRRWSDRKKSSYATGEDHLHVPADRLGAMLAAEDLDFGNSLTWWNGPNLDVPQGPGNARLLTFGKWNSQATVLDAEVERAWGAVYLIGLRQAVSAAPERIRPNLPYVRFARGNGALICYQGGWSREVLLDALLGLVDVVNVCNNNFHRYKFQPRQQYSNLLAVDGFPEYPNTAEGMMLMNTDTYYRLLNCGLRIAAGAGSATGAKTTPVGYNRSYVRVPGVATLTKFIEGWRAGHNFVTNGPMLSLTVDRQFQPGDELRLGAGGRKVRIRAGARCDQPLRSLEIVINGDVVERARSDASAETLQLEHTADLSHGAWIAARATAEDRFLSDEELSAYASTPGTLRGEQPCRLRFGHTSPVYVTVGGSGARVERSVAEARRMLDAFERFAEKTADPRYLPELRDALQRARRRLD